MSTLLFWQGRGNKGANGTQNGRNWIHTPDTLIKGHVAYLVKFLGVTPVTEPKGIEVVQEAIKKLQFTQQLKKSETKDAAKCKKVEITISVDGVAIQEPKSNNIMHQFPLHRISYCADDKGEKKYFSFIAKPGFSINDIINNEESPESEDKYECFVFTSTKLASEITLTIGQAFDLAYRRFMTDNSKIVEIKKLTLLNKKLALQMNAYKKRLQDLSKVTYKDDLASYMNKNSLTDICEYKVPDELKQQFNTFILMSGIRLNGTTPDISELMEDNESNKSHGNGDSKSHNLLIDTPTHNGKHNGSANGKLKEISKKDTFSKNPVVGPKLEELLLESDSDSDFDPRAFESVPPSFPAPHHLENNNVPPPLLAPPPKASKRQPAQPLTNGNDLFGSTPFSIPQQQPQKPQQQLQQPHQSTPIKPNYDISDFNLQTSVFNTNTSFTNGLTGYDPFDTQKAGNIFGNFNGFGNLSEKQNVELNTSFNGFLDKRISEMKDGFSRGISFGNDDFSIDHLDPLKKN